MNTSGREPSRPTSDGLAKNRRAGFAMEASLMILLLISGLVLVLIQTSTTSFRSGFLDYTSSRAFYAAEAGAEWAMSRLSFALEDGSLDAEELNSIHPPRLEGFSFDSFTVEKVGGVEIETITDGPFAGLYSQTQDVTVHSEARSPNGSTNAIRVSGQAQAIPIFQFGVFFEKDIEFTNAPTMHFEGRIHSNGNIYFSSGRHTYFYDVITTPNEAIWNRKDRDLVRDHTFIYDAGGNPVRMRFDSRSHPDPDDFRARSYRDFDDRLKTDAYGVDSLKLPLPQGVDPQEVMEPREGGDGDMEQKAKYSWKSDMYVTVDLENMSTLENMCGPPGYPPIEETGTIAIEPQSPVLPDSDVTFRAVHPQLTCAEFDDRAHLKVVAGGSGYDGGMGGCEFVAQIPSDAEELEIEVELDAGDYAQLDNDVKGKIKYDLAGPLPDGDEPWPTITVDRSGGKDVPGQQAMCLIFDWSFDAWYDPREENFVDQLELDVAQLFNWTQADPGNRSTEILYVNFNWEGAMGAPDPENDGLYPALRIANGANLQGPVTFASNNPLYILGDYNTGTWQPSSLVGDAITTLSNGWDDSEHQWVTGDNEETNAEDTSIYAAVLAGHEDTDCDWYEPGCPGGNYGGGVHSFVRYIEDWTWDDYVFRGSLVSLHVSRVAQGEQSQTFYEPPRRDIRFDTRFQDPANLPPGTPVVGNVIHTAFRPVY